MNARLGEVCIDVIDSEHKTAPRAPIGAEFAVSVGTPHIRSGRLHLEDAVPVDRETYSQWTARGIPEAGDLILTREAPVGQAGMIPAGTLVCLRQRTVLLKPDRRAVDGRFLLYLLVSPLMQERMHAGGVGSTVAHLNIKDVRSLELGRLPRVDDQRAIAGVLGALDDKVALNEQIAESSLELAQALYDNAASASTDWCEWKLKDAATWFSGGTPKTSEPSYWGGDIPWISASSLKTPWLDQSARSVTQLGVQHGTRLAPRGAILFVVRGMSLTQEFRIGVAQRELAFGQDCKALVPHPSVDSTALFLAIRSNSSKILEMVDLAGHGTGRLGTDRIANLVVRLPQGEFAAQFTSGIDSLARAAASAMEQNRTLATLRGTLLPQLITGKIRVKDATRVVEEAV
ncbi:restriction endonuclease subunit S [Streptomyces sp. NBC_01336]|uniref:restriction endonuclease subunit S n=1 Tax=Streptomyces sp. NBC_01336 TaxID=2903829 RepID=UPI002E0DB97E|nr:restriction endonuclease subunit S [Streptomyces sp. NBC_01336]